MLLGLLDSFSSLHVCKYKGIALLSKDNSANLFVVLKLNVAGCSVALGEGVERGWDGTVQEIHVIIQRGGEVVLCVEFELLLFPHNTIYKISYTCVGKFTLARVSCLLQVVFFL